MEIVLYHNPSCSKSRATLALLQELGVEPEVVAYLDTPPSAEELIRIAAKLNVSVSGMIRFKETLTVELGLKQDDQRSDVEWATWLEENPELLERPIAVMGERAVFGRPPDNVRLLVKEMNT